MVREDGSTVPINIGEEASDPVFTIADLLPHLAQKQAGQSLSDAFQAEKLNIILGHRPHMECAEDSEGGECTDIKKEAAKDPIKTRILAILHEKYGICEEDLYSAELQAVPAGAARFVGFDGSLVGGYGHDDRICVFTSLEALLSATNPTAPQCVLFWDKEEIGSEGSTGAKSRFFEYCVEDLIAEWEPSARFRHVMLNTLLFCGCSCCP